MHLDIKSLKTEDRNQLELLLGRHLQKFSMRFYSIPEDKIVDYLSDRLLLLVSRHGNVVLAAKVESKLRGTASLEYLTFESDIYGFPCARIDSIQASGNGADLAEIYDGLVRKIIETSKDLNYSHLTCRVRIEDTSLTHSLQNSGFLLMDTTLEVSWNSAKAITEEMPQNWIIRPFVDSDVPPMKQLAREAFTHRTKTRYSVDPYLPIEKTSELYAKWIENACRKIYGDVVLVATNDKGVIGFNTFRREKNLSEAVGIKIGSHGIGCTSPEMQGKGVMASLLIHTVRWCAENRAEFVRGWALANNYEMIRCCLKAGATITSSFHTFQKWLGN